MPDNKAAQNREQAYKRLAHKRKLRIMDQKAALVKALDALVGLMETCGHPEYIPDDKCDVCIAGKSAIAEVRKVVER